MYILNLQLLSLTFVLTGINTSETHTKEWYQIQAVLRVSMGNFLFFAIFALIMIGVKDQNDKRDAWHHGGWIVKMVLWILLVVLMFFLPNVVISVYGKSFFHNYDIKLIVIFCCFSLARVRGELCKPCFKIYVCFTNAIGGPLPEVFLAAFQTIWSEIFE